MCGSCRKQYNAEYYQRTKNRHNPGRYARRQRDRAVVKQNVIDYLLSHPCVDCGETDIVVLEFDHQRDKAMDVWRLVSRAYRWSRILEEIEKCDVVCANDHRRRTARSFGWAKLTAEVGRQDDLPLAPDGRAPDF